MEWYQFQVEAYRRGNATFHENDPIRRFAIDNWAPAAHASCPWAEEHHDPFTVLGTLA